MNKRQSAIEYLMTYGWMLLVIIIVGMAIFSVIEDQRDEPMNETNSTLANVSDYPENAIEKVEFVEDGVTCYFLDVEASAVDQLSCVKTGGN